MSGFKKTVKCVWNFTRVIPIIGFRQALNFLPFSPSTQGEGKTIEIILPAQGRPLSLRSRSFVDRDVFRYVFVNKYHHPPIVLRPDPIILDLGANIGLSVVELKMLYPQASVIAVEMDAENYAMAGANTAGLPNVSVMHRAVWHDAGTLRYRATVEEDAYSIDEGLAPGASDTRSVETVTVGDVIAITGSPIVDYVKMDIEGAEREVLERNNAWIGSVGCLNIEIHDPDFIEPARHILQSFGFDVRKDTNHWSALLATRSDYDAWLKRTQC
jgi:FkbM family methyltransferase